MTIHGKDAAGKDEDEWDDDDGSGTEVCVCEAIKVATTGKGETDDREAHAAGQDVAKREAEEEATMEEIGGGEQAKEKERNGEKESSNDASSGTEVDVDMADEAAEKAREMLTTTKRTA